MTHESFEIDFQARAKEALARPHLIINCESGERIRSAGTEKAPERHNAHIIAYARDLQSCNRNLHLNSNEARRAYKERLDVERLAMANRGGK